jgi:phosphatidylethanolamine-binding protein (PEBP) family uncharacterized protein
MEVIYNNKIIKNNYFLTPIETQKQPNIELNLDKNKTYTLVMHDPDAVGGNMIHWTLTNIRDNNINNSQILIPYKGPAPPPKSGKHHYIFEIYEETKPNNELIKERKVPMNLLRSKLNLGKPIFKLQFISENVSGGKKRQTQKGRKMKKRIKTQKRRIKFYHH